MPRDCTSDVHNLTSIGCFSSGASSETEPRVRDVGDDMPERFVAQNVPLNSSANWNQIDAWCLSDSYDLVRKIRGFPERDLCLSLQDETAQIDL